MHNFCTLFDSNYLPRALVMYHSLVASGESFKLYVVCFDDLAFNLLNKLKLDCLMPIALIDFESKALLSVKNERTVAEYCWTCTPHVIRYVLDTYKLDQVTYLDADLCFYDKPSILLDEFNHSGDSVLITEHRYTPVYDYSATSGTYCVQFMTFKADERGLIVLQWWQDRCLEWCYARFEDGKFGDQKYLDDWTERFEGVYVLEHLGGGVAPWNIQQYALSENNEKLSVNNFPLIFYHFHGYKYYLNGVHDFVFGYKLRSNDIELIYYPYSAALLKVYQEIYKVAPDFNRGWSTKNPSWRAKLIFYRNWLLGITNEYRIV